jgi:cobalt-zinc-cadmium efflux system membrane fusion protein
MKSISIYTLLISFFVFIQCKKEDPKEESQSPERRKCSNLTDAQLKNAPIETTTLSLQKYRRY